MHLCNNVAYFLKLVRKSEFGPSSAGFTVDLSDFEFILSITNYQLPSILWHAVFDSWYTLTLTFDSQFLWLQVQFNRLHFTAATVNSAAACSFYGLLLGDYPTNPGITKHHPCILNSWIYYARWSFDLWCKMVFWWSCKVFFLCWHYRPNFLIFDEPTNHLDLETVEALAKAFAKFKVNYKPDTYIPCPFMSST